MSLSNNFGSLAKKKGAIIEKNNPHNNVLTSHSPSLNWIFGNNHGIPFGYTACFWGPPKGGKTLIINDFVSKLHETDLEACVVRFDTEWRTELQQNFYAIDEDRLLTIETNHPAQIFDTIEIEINALIQSGKKIKVVVIDSINAIRGKRGIDSKSIEDNTIGDLAATLQTGMQRILPIIRHNKIALLCSVQARAEFDRLEVMRGKTIKAGLPRGMYHLTEYVVKVEENLKKDSKVLDETKTDMNEKGALTGHHIYAVMENSSCSPKGRTAQFFVDYKRGITNLGAEVAELGINQLVISRPNNRTYQFEDLTFNGRDALIDSLDKNSDLRNKIIDVLKQNDYGTVRIG